jgi:hypothetical protein
VPAGGEGDSEEGSEEESEDEGGQAPQTAGGELVRARRLDVILLRLIFEPECARVVASQALK